MSTLEYPDASSIREWRARNPMARVAYLIIKQNEVARSLFARLADTSRLVKKEFLKKFGESQDGPISEFGKYIDDLTENHISLQDKANKVLDGKYNEVSDIDMLCMALIIGEFNSRSGSSEGKSVLADLN